MNKMKHLGIIGFILFANSAMPYRVIGQEKTFLDVPYLETSAKADTLIMPDRIYLSILILEKDTKGKVSVEELESKMANALKGLGIDTQKELVLTDAGSEFSKYFLKRVDVLKNKYYKLKVSTAMEAGRVLIALEALSISNVFIDHVEYSKAEQLMRELRGKAAAKCKRQADIMAKAIGQRVGDALLISDQEVTDISRVLQGKVSGVMIRGYTTVPETQQAMPNIEFEKLLFEISLQAKFKLIPN